MKHKDKMKQVEANLKEADRLITHLHNQLNQNGSKKARRIKMELIDSIQWDKFKEAKRLMRTL